VELWNALPKAEKPRALKLAFSLLTALCSPFQM
jgi:hypothetical protein